MKHREILGYGESGDSPSKYDKYTRDKWMKFPFEVFYEDKFYDLQADGMTEWIQVKRPAHWSDTVDNHWINTPIYIPSYAKEMGEVGYTGPKEILYKVEAINVSDGLLEHYHEEEEKGNLSFELELAPDGAKYVATYHIPVQLSGWIYDFTITGVNNGSVYAGKSEVGSNELSFVMSKTEKKAGTKNRFGEACYRYLIDGSLSPSWDKLNTLPLTDGKSKQFSKQGALWKGQSFTFEVKTMSNLLDDDGHKDRIEIIPTYTYVDNSGNKIESDKLRIFYNNPDGSGKYIEYGSDRERISTNWTNSKIGSKMQEGAYYTEDMKGEAYGGTARDYHFGEWSTFTANMYNKVNTPSSDEELSSEKYLGKESKTCCLSHIILNPVSRLFSGEWEQLSLNSHKNAKYTPKEFEDLEKYSDMDTSWDADDDERFRKSIQTWYGEYYMPSELFIVNTDKHPEFADPDYTIEDYMEAANGGLGIQEDDAVFEKSGYLIINFDIRTYKEGKGHLKYLGASAKGNMWDMEGYNNSPLAGDPTPIAGFKDGDVVVVDLEKSVTDKYSSGVHNVN